MNLTDAIKSQKPFKRKSYDSDMWCHVVENDGGCAEIEFMSGPCKTFMAYVGDLIADDWEIQEIPVTITPTQFREAVKATSGMFWPNPAAAVLAEKLGLEYDP